MLGVRGLGIVRGLGWVIELGEARCRMTKVEL